MALLADQIGCEANDFTGYAARPTTLREHRAEIEAQVGWDRLERSIRFAENLTRAADDGLEEVGRALSRRVTRAGMATSAVGKTGMIDAAVHLRPLCAGLGIGC